ncbi:MAG: hypothetical protein MH321_07595 [Leptospiraceae bacterium]|nr:hypothetical protein [Leptospiraceae bacterium]
MFYQYYSDYSKPHKTDFKSLAIVSAEKEYSDFILYSFDKVDFYNFYGQKYNKEKKVIMLPEISKQNLTLLPNKFILLEAGLLGKLADDQIHILKDQYKMKNISFYGSEMKIFTRE